MSSEVEQVTKVREYSMIRELARKRFWNVVYEKWPKIREECSKHWKGPNAAECQFEKSIMREHIEVFEHGVLMSLVVFGTLRLTAHPKFEKVAENYVKPFFRLAPSSPKATSKTKPKKKHTKSSHVHQTGKKSQLLQDNINPPTAAAIAERQRHGRHFKTYLEKKRDTHVERIHKAAEAPHDFLIGTLVGLSATVFFLRPRQMRLDFEEVPLCPGRSFVSEQMCQDFIQIYQETDPKAFDFDKQDKADANLKSFEQFALNCILRTNYIQKRKLNGEEKPWVIPDPGPWENEDEEAEI